MTSKYLIFALGFSVSLLSFSTAQAQLMQVEQAPVKENIIDEPESYVEELTKLLTIQTIQQKIGVLKSVYHVIDAEQQKQTLANKKFDAMAQCNIKNLSTVYENPKEAWDNITKEYDAQETKLTAELLNTNAPQPSNGIEKRAELFAHWHLSTEVLKDVYAQPEKYGKLKNKVGFDLWDDQKYMYTDQITAFISSLNSIVGRTGRIPGVSSENTYQENEAAFKKFINELPQQTLAAIPAELKSFPKPPNALPPAEEILRFPEDPAKSQSVFPEWPEPWKQFIKSGFTKYNPTGEMAKMFKPKSLVFTDEVKHKDPIYINNRLHVYQGLKKEKTSAEHLIGLSKKHQQKTIEHIEKDLKDFGVNETFDANDISSIQRVQTPLINQKKELIQSIRKKITQNQKNFPQISIMDEDDAAKQFYILPYAEQLDRLSKMDPNSEEYSKAKNLISSSQTNIHLTYINALEKDLEGNLTLFPTNAASVDHLKAEFDAREALREEFVKHQNSEMEKNYRKKIDNMCLNGGV